LPAAVRVAPRADNRGLVIMVVAKAMRTIME
jgi:hypothetical protein